MLWADHRCNHSLKFTDKYHWKIPTIGGKCKKKKEKGILTNRENITKECVAITRY